MELWRERRLWSVGRLHAVPAMHVDLVMSERQGIEIDYCPQFRDIWLGRTELDKIIDRSSQFSAPHEKALPQQASSGWTAPLQNAAPSPPPPSYRSYGHSDHDDEGHGGSDYRGKRRKSWLGELFD